MATKRTGSPLRVPPEAFVILIGCIVLVGWVTDSSALKSVSPSLPSMKVNAATASILAGTSVWLLRRRARPMLARACAAGVLAIGGLTLVEYLVGWQPGIDQLVAHETAHAVGTSSPGRMGANAALVFLLDGLALLLLDVQVRRIRPAQLLALAGGVAALVAFTGYVFGSYRLTGFGSATRISIYAATAYVLLTAAILLARPNDGVMALTTSRGAGGLTIRRLLIPALVVPLAIGWLLHRGETAGVYAPDQTLGLLVVAVSAFFLTITWWTARSLDHTDTELRRSEQESRELARTLDERAHELERANAELNEYAYVVSHDLAEPLRAISGFAQLLADRNQGQLDERSDRYIGHVLEGASRLQTLIDSLLAYARTGENELRREPVDLQPLLQQTLGALSTRIEESHATVSAGPLPTVSGDPVLLGQLLQNLISNAIKFGDPTEPRVAVAAARAPGAWELSVTDNGIGIEPRHAERIFRVFQRLHNRADYPGSGVGLAVCKKIVERHAGRIWVDPPAAGAPGATLRFTIPDDKAPRT